jgi:hypothetical protein
MLVGRILGGEGEGHTLGKSGGAYQYYYQK